MSRESAATLSEGVPTLSEGSSDSVATVLRHGRGGVPTVARLSASNFGSRTATDRGRAHGGRGVRADRGRARGAERLAHTKQRLMFGVHVQRAVCQRRAELQRLLCMSRPVRAAGARAVASDTPSAMVRPRSEAGSDSVATRADCSRDASRSRSATQIWCRRHCGAVADTTPTRVARSPTRSGGRRHGRGCRRHGRSSRRHGRSSRRHGRRCRRLQSGLSPTAIADSIRDRSEVPPTLSELPPDSVGTPSDKGRGGFPTHREPRVAEGGFFA